mmetsp:Transcript_123391/g.293216  ORF Transcript_123391/g.293216 Transcript_123391/m.293216 type:complete len:279 (-) Transcript_123391:58-894(-)
MFRMVLLLILFLRVPLFLLGGFFVLVFVFFGAIAFVGLLFCGFLLWGFLFRLLSKLRAHVLPVQCIDCCFSGFRGFEVDESEPLPIVRVQKHGGGHLAKLGKNCSNFGIVPGRRHVLDVEVGVLLHDGFFTPLLSLDEGAHKDRAVGDLHAIDFLYRNLRGFLGLVVDEAVSSRLAVVVCRHLAREDVAEDAKGVVQGLVVDSRIQAFHENVAGGIPPSLGVALAPHHATRLALDAHVVQRLERALGILYAVVVHVPVAKRLAGGIVAANTAGRDVAS